jgi:hypothetical protein
LQLPSDWGAALLVPGVNAAVSQRLPEPVEASIVTVSEPVTVVPVKHPAQMRIVEFLKASKGCTAREISGGTETKYEVVQELLASLVTSGEVIKDEGT